MAGKKKGKKNGPSKAGGREIVTYQQIRRNDVLLARAKGGFGNDELLKELLSVAEQVNAVQGKTEAAKAKRLAFISRIIDAVLSRYEDVRILGKGSTKDTFELLDRMGAIDTLRVRISNMKGHAKRKADDEEAREIVKPRPGDHILLTNGVDCPLTAKAEENASEYAKHPAQSEERKTIVDGIVTFFSKQNKTVVAKGADNVYFKVGEKELKTRIITLLSNVLAKGKAPKDEGRTGKSFTSAEDDAIIAFANEHSERSTIPFDLLELPDRSTDAIRRRYNGELKDRIVDGALTEKAATSSFVPFTEDEDALIAAHALEAMKMRERPNWRRLAAEMSGRASHQLLHRWSNTLQRCVDDKGVFQPDKVGGLTSLYTVMRENSDLCRRYVESLSLTKLQPGEEGRMFPGAGYINCHEHQHKPREESGGGYGSKSFEVEGVTITAPDFHVAACTAKHGPRTKAEAENNYTRIDADDFSIVTASHICQNSFCVNPDHIKWESLGYNLSRKGCSGYILVMLGNGGWKFLKNDMCKHKDRCKNFFTHSNMSAEGQKNLFG